MIWCTSFCNYIWVYQIFWLSGNQFFYFSMFDFKQLVLNFTVKPIRYILKIPNKNLSLCGKQIQANRVLYKIRTNN